MIQIESHQRDFDAIIVGAGLAGLRFALRLQEAGLSFLILEASNGIGGRVRTSLVEGFRLDHGFQVFLTAHPEAQEVLDYPALKLGRFLPGAEIRWKGRFHRVADPWRHPWDALRSLLNPVGTLLDKLRVGFLRWESCRGSIEDLLSKPDTTTLAALLERGFTPSMIERFFQPFFGGIFLDSSLETTARMLYFVFRMFALGDAALPAAGMEAIPKQLAAELPPDSLQTDSEVRIVSDDSVELRDGPRVSGKVVILATEGPKASQLRGSIPDCGSRSVTCLYFAADKPPAAEPILFLKGEDRGPVNNLCVPSQVSASYAPPGAALISATVLGSPAQNDCELEAAVRAQLTGWFGAQVSGWRNLRTYRIAHALPNQNPCGLPSLVQPVYVRRGLYVCGDHRDTASIQGALVSGRRAAEAVIRDLGAGQSR